mmetsp:Transcript_93726/g.264589  ORF Transcript_93726/g.264589 Transcript_93726/m.264589 type:complete len:403 (-) Transcript_93726:9-1217(-)
MVASVSWQCALATPSLVRPVCLGRWHGSRRAPGRHSAGLGATAVVANAMLFCSVAGRRAARAAARPLLGKNPSRCRLRSTLRRAASSSSSGAPLAHVITACNAYRQETVVLERSARANGYAFHAVGVGGPWRGVGTKLALYDSALKELVGGAIAPGDPVMLLDAWDTVVLGPASELREKLGAMGMMEPGGWVLCCTDRICAPDYKMSLEMERIFPSIATPWRYPNSGGLAGTGEALRAFLHSLVHGSEGGAFSEDGDDQLRLQSFLAACAAHGDHFPLQLDERCSIFQGMGEPACGWDYEAGSTPPRLRNHVTSERPLVAHGCGGHGRWFLADVYRELQLLEYLGIEGADLEGLDYAGLVAPGCIVTEDHWVDQPPWDFPFQAFEVIRSIAIREAEAAGASR